MCWSKLDFYSVKENGNIFAFILQESPKPHPPHGYYIHGDVGELKFFFFSCGSKLISHFKHAYIEFGGIGLDCWRGQLMLILCFVS